MMLPFQDFSSSLASNRPPLLAGEVHVWGVALPVDEETAHSVMPCLSADEQERAERLLSSQRRREYIAAHAGLRTVLGRYSDQRAERLRFGRGASGKPFLEAGGSHGEPLRFNLSHSHGRALIAVANEREVGVDLEMIRPDMDVLRLAKRFFSDHEVARMEAAAPGDRHALFCQLWVVREAVSKAEGTGIRFPLHREHVVLSRFATEARLIRESRDQSVAARFLPLEAGWIGAVASEGTDWRIVLCH